MKDASSIPRMAEALKEVRRLILQMDECEIAEAALALSAGGKHSGVAMDELEWIADTMNAVVEAAREVEKEMAGDGYEERVRALEAEGMTRSDAQGVADAEELNEKKEK